MRINPKFLALVDGRIEAPLIEWEGWDGTGFRDRWLKIVLDALSLR